MLSNRYKLSTKYQKNQIKYPSHFNFFPKMYNKGKNYLNLKNVSFCFVSSDLKEFCEIQTLMPTLEEII